MLTICVLSTNTRHEGHLLDVCDVPVYDVNNNVAGYLGAAWGEHANPGWPEILVWDFCETTAVDATLSQHGLKRMFQEVDLPV